MLSEVSKVIKNVKDTIETKVNNTAGTPSMEKIKLGTREIEEIKLISQGGYAYIFLAKDVQTGELFALKKMICQNARRLKTAKNEIDILKSIPNHPNLVKLFDTEIVKVHDGHHAYLLLELCEEGTIFDLIVKHETERLTEEQIISIMKQVCEGVKALHSASPPIVHRDIKIENILTHNNTFKLCDFGSCSTKSVDFAKIPQEEYALYEEEYEKNTTLMYRPPEMCDPYQRYLVNEKVDIWMLGCVLYTICFYKNPFKEASKLSIVNAAYTIPHEHSYPEKLIDIIRSMLTPNPQFRPSIQEISNIFNDYYSLDSIQLNPEAQRLKTESLSRHTEMKKFVEDSKSCKHEGDIPIEEIIKLQEQIKKKNAANEPQFKDWKSAKRSQNNSAKKSEGATFDNWSGFGTLDGQKSNTNQFEGFQSATNVSAFDTFAQFTTNPTEKQEPQTSQGWEAFDFSSPNEKVGSTPNFENWGSVNAFSADTTAQSGQQSLEQNKEDVKEPQSKNTQFDAFANF